MSTPKKEVVVVLDKSTADVDQVAEQCRAAGLEVRQSLGLLKQLTGAIDPEREEDLRRVPGVRDVTPSREIHLAPPDSDIQ